MSHNLRPRSGPANGQHPATRQPANLETNGQTSNSSRSRTGGRSYSSVANAAGQHQQQGPWQQQKGKLQQQPLQRPNTTPPTHFQSWHSPYARLLSSAASSAADLYGATPLDRPQPPADQPGCHESRKSCRVRLPNGEMAEMVLAESWADVDAHIDWLLEDAQVDGFVTQDSLKRIKHDAKKRTKATASATAEQPEQPDPWGDAASWTADDFADGAGSSDVASPPANRTSAAPHRQATLAAADLSYLLGLDTESYHARVESRNTHDFFRKFPATLQLSSRTRVLVVPIYWLVLHQQQPISPRFAALFAQANVRWTGVGLASDLSPFKDTLNIDLPRDRIVDTDTVANKWRIPGSLDELSFQFTDLFAPASTCNHADTPAAAVVESLGGILLESQPSIPAKYLNNFYNHMSTCSTCAPQLIDLDPSHIPPYLYLEDALLGIGTGLTYPNLNVGWKSKHLSMSNWDVAPHHWTVAMLVYAGLDAIASRAVGVAMMPVLNPYTWIHAYTLLDPPMPMHTHYRLPHLRQFHDAPLEWLRSTLAHIVTCRESGRPAVAGVHKYVATWKLLKGIKNRRSVLNNAIDWFIRTRVVTAVDQDGMPVTDFKAEMKDEAKVFLTHVCLATDLTPLFPPEPTAQHPGGLPVPEDLICFVSLEFPCVPGYGERVTSEAVIEFLAQSHPDLALFDEASSLRVAKAWMGSAPEEAVVALIEDLRRRIAQMERALVDRAAAKREEREGKGAKKKSKGERRGKGGQGKEQPQENEPTLDESSSTTTKRRSSEHRRDSTPLHIASEDGSASSTGTKKHKSQDQDDQRDVGRGGHDHRGRGGRGGNGGSSRGSRRRGGSWGGNASGNGSGGTTIYPA